MSDAALRLPSSTPLCVGGLPPCVPAVGDVRGRSKSLPTRSTGVSFYSPSSGSSGPPSPLPPAGVMVQEGRVLLRAMAKHHTALRHPEPGTTTVTRLTVT
ncbi:hypothetical protein E2C01_000081 [Portunus trituberculatus]|uniref:Uncharacterized protein n=2 Tax=Portunus trituberculatus TaxID=210409 RepID=A0A5B7CD83_PORTR|nr:hypothetical protein [Portunus trituberculatus]